MAQKSLAEWYEETYRNKSPVTSQAVRPTSVTSEPVTLEPVVSEPVTASPVTAEPVTTELVASTLTSCECPCAEPEQEFLASESCIVEGNETESCVVEAKESIVVDNELADIEHWQAMNLESSPTDAFSLEEDGTQRN